MTTTIVKKTPVIEYRAMPEVEEHRNELLQEMESILNQAKIETRSLSVQENKRFQELKAKIGTMDREREQRDLESLTNDSFITKRDYKAPLSPKQQEEIRAFVNYVKTGQMEGRDLSSGQSGSVIPKTVESMVIAKVKELAPIFEKMTHYQVTGNLSIPSYPWDAHTVTFVEDFSQIASSGGTFLTVDLQAHAIASLALIGNNLINRTDVPVIDIIVQQIATSIANFINDEVINNTSGRFSGTLMSINQLTTATGATTLTIDDLLTVQMAVPSQLQNEAVWIMHPDTFGVIRKIKDADGRPLLAGQATGLSNDLGFNLLGREVLLDENVSLMGPNKMSVIYGNLSGMVCNQNATLRTQILQERYIDVNATGVITFMDLDFNIAQPRAIAGIAHPVA